MRTLIFLSLLSLVSCSASADRSSASEFKGEWIATTFDTTRPPTVLFVDNERVAGFAGCNRYFASYKVSGEKISFSDIGATKMLCIKSMETEGSYLKALGEASSFKIGEGGLVLYSDGRELLRFKKQP